MSARLLLERASALGSGRATFLLAETYDERELSRLRVQGLRGDPEQARQLYLRAYAAGIPEALERAQR